MVSCQSHLNPPMVTPATSKNAYVCPSCVCVVCVYGVIILIQSIQYPDLEHELCQVTHSQLWESESHFWMRQSVSHGDSGCSVWDSGDWEGGLAYQEPDVSQNKCCRVQRNILCQKVRKPVPLEQFSMSVARAFDYSKLLTLHYMHKSIHPSSSITAYAFQGYCEPDGGAASGPWDQGSWPIEWSLHVLMCAWGSVWLSGLFL